MQPKLETFFSNDGEAFTVKITQNIYFVYVLLLDDKPIYVGSTFDLPIRIKQHKYDKKLLNSYQVIYKSGSKDVANAFEFACITFLKSFDKECLNKQNINSISERVYIK